MIENENAEAEAKEVEGTSTETMLNDAVDARGGTGEEHSELNMVVEESDHIVGEEHHARCVHSVEEGGSIVLHVSRDMNEKEKDDEEAGETAAAKETEELSKENVEVRRFIEERRTTPKEEKQRLKEVTKCLKMYQRQQHERKDSKTSKKNIPGIKSARKRVLITKIKNEKGKSSRLEKGLPMSLANSTKSFSTTMKKKKLNKKSVKMKMRAASMCMTTTQMR